MTEIKRLVTLHPGERNSGIMKFENERGKTRELKYWTDRRAVIKEAGLYDVTYTEQEKIHQASGNTYTLRIVKEALPIQPESYSALRLHLGLTFSPRIVDNIIDPLEAEDITYEEGLEKLGSKKYLKSAKGIGPRTATKIIQSLGDVDTKEFNLIKVLQKYGIPYDRGTKRSQWARQYFGYYPSKLEELNNNPYLLRSISDRKKSATRVVMTTYNVKNPAAYPFDMIDKAVLSSGNGDWEHHKKRVSQIISEGMKDIVSQGHSVCKIEEIGNHLVRRNIHYIIDYIDGDKRDLDEKTLKDLIYLSPDLQIVRFMEEDRSIHTGVAFKHMVKWRDTIVETIDALADQKSIFNESELTQMYYSALANCPVALTSEQTNSLHKAMQSRISAVKGGPGTGKTTLMQTFLTGILHKLNRHYTVNPLSFDKNSYKTAYHIYLLAPTGVATQRIRNGLVLTDPRTGETIQPSRFRRDIEIDHLTKGEVILTTLHSFLGFRGDGAGYYPPDPHPCIICVDEISMMDEEVLAALMRYVLSCVKEKTPCSLFFTGDIGQLPPVGAGFPFRDLLSKQYGASIPTTELSVVKRQEGASMIVHGSKCLQQGMMLPHVDDYASWGMSQHQDLIWPGDINAGAAWLNKHSGTPVKGNTTVSGLLTSYKNYIHSIHKDNNITERDIQIVLPLRNPSKIERAAWYVRGINKELQEQFAKNDNKVLQELVVQPDKDDDTKLFKVNFCVGDKIIHTGENGYRHAKHEAIMRGSIGYITDIDPIFGMITVNYAWLDFDVTYETPYELSMLDLAYAITGHASQGSEFDYCMVVLPDRAGPTLVDRGWLYTTITRAKKCQLLISSHNRVSRAATEDYGAERNTLLSTKILYN